MEKRLRKFYGLKAKLPAPHLSVGGRSAKTTDWTDLGDEIELLAIGWGSTGDVFQDVMRSDELRGRKIAYLHYTYLWPLRTQELQSLAKRSKRIVLVEQNYQGQLGMLIRMECGLDIPDKILKYDGRPFFYDELLSSVIEKCTDNPANGKSSHGIEFAGHSS
jgi:2-oxoglutarate ferredoxin oxidoreductase subunit alpha